MIISDYLIIVGLNFYESKTKSASHQIVLTIHCWNLKCYYSRLFACSDVYDEDRRRCNTTTDIVGKWTAQIFPTLIFVYISHCIDGPRIPFDNRRLLKWNPGGLAKTLNVEVILIFLNVINSEIWITSAKIKWWNDPYFYHFYIQVFLQAAKLSWYHFEKPLLCLVDIYLF